eukprot:6823327-Prymnesium_polylepis.2
MATVPERQCPGTLEADVSNGCAWEVVLIFRSASGARHIRHWSLASTHLGVGQASVDGSVIEDHEASCRRGGRVESAGVECRVRRSPRRFAERRRRPEHGPITILRYVDQRTKHVVDVAGRVRLGRLKVRVRRVNVELLHPGACPADHCAAHEWRHARKSWPLRLADDWSRGSHHGVDQRGPRGARLARYR